MQKGLPLPAENLHQTGSIIHMQKLCIKMNKQGTVLRKYDFSVVQILNLHNCHLKKIRIAAHFDLEEL